MTSTRFRPLQRACVAAVLTLTLAPMSMAQLTKEAKDRVLERMTKIITSYAYVPGVDFSKWPSMIEAQKAGIEKSTSENEFQDAVNEALEKFGFSHISIQTPSQSRQRREGSAVGIGINIKEQEDGILIVRVMSKSPAEEAGLKPGELIVEADGKSVRKALDVAGKEGDPVTLTIKQIDGATRQVKIVRRKFSTVRKEELQWLDKDTALLSVHTFDLTYDPDRVEDLMEEAAKARDIVVDLRGNGGGVVLNVQHFLGHFLPSGTPIGTFINKRMVERFVEEKVGKVDDLKAIAEWSDNKMRVTRSSVPPFKGNVAVLVNGGTGSGAEIAAAALREKLGSPVLGTKSAGAVLVALMVPLPEGFTLLYPMMDYVSSNGQRLEGSGVTPDEEAKDPGTPLPGVRDEVIEKAVARLSAMPEPKKIALQPASL